MKRLFGSLVIMAVLPLMTSSTHHKTVQPAAFGTVAFAGHVLTGSLVECTCSEVNPDGTCACCGATLSNFKIQETAKHAGHAANQVPKPAAVGPNSLGMWARALLSLIALLAWS